MGYEKTIREVYQNIRDTSYKVDSLGLEYVKSETYRLVGMDFFNDIYNKSIEISDKLHNIDYELLSGYYELYFREFMDKYPDMELKVYMGLSYRSRLSESYHNGFKYDRLSEINKEEHIKRIVSFTIGDFLLLNDKYADNIKPDTETYKATELPKSRDKKADQRDRKLFDDIISFDIIEQYKPSIDVRFERKDGNYSRTSLDKEKLNSIYSSWW